MFFDEPYALQQEADCHCKRDNSENTVQGEDILRCSLPGGHPPTYRAMAHAAWFFLSLHVCTTLKVAKHFMDARVLGRLLCLDRWYSIVIVWSRFMKVHVGLENRCANPGLTTILGQPVIETLLELEATPPMSCRPKPSHLAPKRSKMSRNKVTRIHLMTWVAPK